MLRAKHGADICVTTRDKHLGEYGRRHEPTVRNAIVENNTNLRAMGGTMVSDQLTLCLENALQERYRCFQIGNDALFWKL